MVRIFALICAFILPGAALADTYSYRDVATVNPCKAYTKSIMRIAEIPFGAGDVAEVDNFFDDSGYPVVSLTFTEIGVKKFKAAQRGKVGRHLPMCLGAEILANPILYELVLGNAVQISASDHKQSLSLTRRLRAYFNLD